MAGDAKRWLGSRVVVFRVDEAHRRLRDAERARGVGLEVVDLELAVLPVEEVRAMRRDAQDVTAGQLSLGDQRPLAGGGVHAVEVGGRQLLLVGEVGARVAPDRPLAVWRDVEISHRVVGELDEPFRRHVERLPEGEGPAWPRPRRRWSSAECRQPTSRPPKLPGARCCATWCSRRSSSPSSPGPAPLAARRRQPASPPAGGRRR